MEFRVQSSAHRGPAIVLADTAMSDTVIRVENLGKRYKIGKREGYLTLRDTLASAFKSPLRWSRKRNSSPAMSHQPSATSLEPSANNYIWALKDVTFEVTQGEVVGIIGRNGAGKTTLLKILSRITEPTEGYAEIKGRIGSLLEVGTGFHPELTGRENIYLNGAILGMKKREIDKKFDEIVAFAEIEKFIDTPVKYYSSGMYVRLAFAVAAHLEPEILLVDEVLAVGDAAFQKKCLGKMGDVAKEGRTVLFVSHNMGAIQKLCPRSILLEEGRLSLNGESTEVIRQYLGGARRADGRLNTAGRHFPPRCVEIRDAWLEKEGVQTSCLLFGDRADIIIQVEVKEPKVFSVELILRQADGMPVAFAPSGLAFDWELDGAPGVITIRAELPPARLAVGNYSVDIMLADTGVRFFDYIESAITFRIESAAIGKRNWCFSQKRGQGHELWDVKFSVDTRLEASRIGRRR